MAAALRIVLMYLAVVGVALAAGVEVEAPGGQEKVNNFRALSESGLGAWFDGFTTNLVLRFFEFLIGIAQGIAQQLLGLIGMDCPSSPVIVGTPRPIDIIFSYCC
jgi:hypothetical protein